MPFFKSLKNATAANERLSSVLHAGLAVAVGLATLATALGGASLWG